jgi:hypothetical protein
VAAAEAAAAEAAVVEAVRKNSAIILSLVRISAILA